MFHRRISFTLDKYALDYISRLYYIHFVFRCKLIFSKKLSFFRIFLLLTLYYYEKHIISNVNEYFLFAFSQNTTLKALQKGFQGKREQPQVPSSRCPFQPLEILIFREDGSAFGAFQKRHSLLR